jgi:hypothetical protein
LSYEFQLCALAVFLYLYDSTVLLYANEAVLSCDGRGVWHVSTGSDSVVIAGRRFCLLNPFRMYWPCTKLRWNLYSPDSPSSDHSWSEELTKLQQLAPWTVMAALAMLVLLPLGLFTSLGTRAMLPAITVLYGSILIASVLMRRRCSLPELTRPRFAIFLIECLACPPFGVNLIRRASLMSEVREPLLQAAKRLLPAAEWDALVAHCIATLEQELAGLGEASPERPSLELRLVQLRTWTALQ